MKYLIKILIIALLYSIGKGLTETYVSSSWEFFFAYMTGVIVAGVLTFLDNTLFKNK